MVFSEILDEKGLIKEIETGKYVLVLYYANWHDPCTKLRNHFDEHSSEINKALAKKGIEKRVMLDCDHATWRLSKYQGSEGFHSIPTIKLYKDSIPYLESLIGNLEYSRFIRWIDDLPAVKSH